MRQGGKKWARREIVGRFPSHYKSYVEVFGGAAWIMFYKQRRNRGEIEIYNDYDSDLYTLFDIVQNRKFSFQAAIGGLNSREGFNDMIDRHDKQDYTNHYLQIELEQARKVLPPKEFACVMEEYLRDAADFRPRQAAVTYNLLHKSYGAGGKSFNCQPFNVETCRKLIDDGNKRLQDVVVENKSYEFLIPNRDRQDTFFYLDPPYVQAEKCYEVKFRQRDHILLAQQLSRIDGKFLLSYNDHEMVRDLYRDCCIVELSRPDSLAQAANPGQMYKELLIANYDLHSTEAGSQLSLFD